MNTSFPSTLNVRDAQAQMREATAFLLDVRGLDEYAAGHADGAVCHPLPKLEQWADGLPTDRPLLVMCLSGHRSAVAVQRLRQRGRENAASVQGGFQAWRRAGLPVAKQTNAISLERQVRIVAGALVLLFSLLGLLVNHAFFYGAAAVGLLLTVTGALGICPMISVLKLLPWNRGEH